MAATVRLTGDAGPLSVTTLSVGRFGAAVSRLLAAGSGHRGHVVSAEAFAAGAPAERDVLVVSMWRPMPAFCRLVDGLARSHGFSWLPVESDGTTVRVGPWFRPAAAGCFECYYSRRLQHDTQLRATSDVHAAYDRDPDLGPGGFLPHHARLSAGLAARLLAGGDGGDGGDTEAGDVLAANLKTLKTARHRLTPLHSCVWCAERGRLRHPW